MSEILLKIDGINYSNFKSASVTLRLDAIADEFRFVAIATKKQELPFTIGAECQITVNGLVVLTGYIEIVDIDYDTSNHSINIEGRSKTGDIVDSHIDKIELEPPIMLKEVIEKVISDIGSDSKVIDQTTGMKSFTKSEDKISPKVGENAFTFIERLSRKRQVLLMGDENGDVVIVNPNSSSAPRDLQNVINGFDNNIRSGSVSRDATDTFNKYLFRSQLNVSTLNFSGDVSSKDIVNQKSVDVFDNKVRSSRQLVMQAETSSSDTENEKRAKWEANIRETRSIVYSVTLAEYSFNNQLWKPNQVVSVIDDFAQINDLMLINSVTYTLEEDFIETTLGLVSKNAYSLELREPTKSTGSNAGSIPVFS